MSKQIIRTRIVDGYRFKTIWTGPLQEVYYIDPKGVETKAAEFRTKDKGVRLLKTPWQDSPMTVGLTSNGQDSAHDDANETACLRVARSLSLARFPKNIPAPEKKPATSPVKTRAAVPTGNTSKSSQTGRRTVSIVVPALPPTLEKLGFERALGRLSEEG